jgi:hypothetical protein
VRSLQHLVDFVDNIDSSHEVVITELKLYQVTLISDPSDGGLNVLREFFSRSHTGTALTKVTLLYCDFGINQLDAEQLLAAFHTSRTVTDLSIRRIRKLEGAAKHATVAKSGLCLQ